MICWPSAFCIGTDQVDLPAAAAGGVAVFNAPYSNTRSVVALALAEVIALTRRMAAKNAAMHAGLWDKSAAGAHEVRGRTLGIVGYGNIGSQLSVLAEALGMRVCFYHVADRLALGSAYRCASLDELLPWRTSSRCTWTAVPETRAASALPPAAMRPGSLLLNLSRGFVVDEMALREHLQSGHLAGAAVDAFATEPSRRGEPFVSACAAWTT